jgi:hypothetical protein
MSGEAPSRGAVALFLFKFAVFSTALLGLWWWALQPWYVELAGQTAGLVIRYLANFPITAMKVTVDPSGVLTSKTLLAYTHDGHEVTIHVAFLVANLPAYAALVLATAALGWRRRLRALGLGSAILFVGHVAFLTVMFIFAREAKSAPELPTAFGLFVMTLPFPLWIVLAFWDRAAAWVDGAAQPSGQNKAQPED